MGRKTKIVQLTNRFIIGGPSIILAVLQTRLGDDFISKLWAGKKADTEESADFLLDDKNAGYEEIPAMHRTINPLNDVKAYFQIKRKIRAFQPDIVHTHSSKPGALGRLAANREKVPVIIHTYHGHAFHGYFNPFLSKIVIIIERFLTRFCTTIVAISEKQKGEIVDQYKICKAEKVEVVPLGFPLFPFYSSQEEKRKTFRSFYQISENELAIGIVGRLVPIKNHKLFIEAIASVLKQSSREIRIIIIGDGDERQNIQNILEQNKILYNYYPEDPAPKQATLTSWVTAMDEAYAGLDIVALTSLNEGTPIALIEAQAASRPIVTTEVGGIADIVIKNKTAFCTPSNDIDAFSKALLQLINDAELRNIMGEAGRKHALEYFDESVFIRKMQELYHKLLIRHGVKTG